MVVSGRADHRGRPVRAARPGRRRRRGGVRGRGRPPGPRHRLGAAGAPRRRGPRGGHHPVRRRGAAGERRACCGSSADAGYQVQRQYADGVVHLSFPIAPTEQLAARCRGAASSAPRRGRSPGCSPRAASRSTAPAPPARASARPSWATCATAGSPAPIVPGPPAARDRVGGLPAYRSARRRPGRGRPGASSPCRRTASPDVVADAAAAGAHGLVVVSAGFAEAGPAGRGRRSASWSARPTRAGMRVVGPNCLGIANTDPAVRLNATLAPAAAGGRAGSASSASPARWASRCWPRPTGAGSACPASCRPATAPTSPATTCCSTGRTTRGTDVILLYLETLRQPAQVRPDRPADRPGQAGRRGRLGRPRTRARRRLPDPAARSPRCSPTPA